MRQRRSGPGENAPSFGVHRIRTVTDLAAEVSRVELPLQHTLYARVAAEIKGQVAVRVDGGRVGASLEKFVADAPPA